MVKLLTVNDIADRWQKDVSTIRRYISDGVLVPCTNVPGNMFHPQYIEELEGVKLDKFSPFERRRLEKEAAEYKEKYETLKAHINKLIPDLMQTINL